MLEKTTVGFLGWGIEGGRGCCHASPLELHIALDQSGQVEGVAVTGQHFGVIGTALKAPIEVASQGPGGYSRGRDGRNGSMPDESGVLKKKKPLESTGAARSPNPSTSPAMQEFLTRRTFSPASIFLRTKWPRHSTTRILPLLSAPYARYPPHPRHP